MNNVEVKQVDRSRTLATELLVMGLVKLPEKRRSDLNFDPDLEVGYLVRLPAEMRRGQLKKEVQTALGELYLSQVDHTYEMEQGRLIDSETRQDVETLTALGEVSEEVEAIQKINHLMGNGSDLVVNISQENKDLGYPDNMVDMWMRCADGKIRVLRCKVEGSEETFKNFYKNIGGEKENPDKREMLSDPIEIKNLRLAEVLNMLVIVKCETSLGENNIETITESLLQTFEKRFKDKLIRDPNTILRFYLAVKDAIKNLGKGKVNVNEVIGSLLEERYLSGAIRIRQEKGGGCGLSSLGGEFAKQGWVLVMKDGKLTSHFGKTEGLIYCTRCGCWHEGSKCPYCDKG
ncbi:MAG: hypothetical protein NTY75_03810 [Candidatus Shapirobacteria bacterium]|nr:hypothetical protein [Candidatus Shapirobacteria bacterium]